MSRFIFQWHHVSLPPSLSCPLLFPHLGRHTDVSALYSFSQSLHLSPYTLFNHRKFLQSLRFVQANKFDYLQSQYFVQANKFESRFPLFLFSLFPFFPFRLSRFYKAKRLKVIGLPLLQSEATKRTFAKTPNLAVANTLDFPFSPFPLFPFSFSLNKYQSPSTSFFLNSEKNPKNRKARKFFLFFLSQYQVR